MKRPRGSLAILVLALAAVTVLADACSNSGGGGGNGGGNPGGTPPPALVISTNSLPAGVQGQAYNYTFQATGGTAPYQWSVISSNGLPPGLQLSSGGLLSGSTNFQGRYDTSFQVQDSSSPLRTSSVTLSLMMVGPLTIQTATLPSGASPPNVGVNYGAVLDATGGVGSYVWSLFPGSGSLPPGLTLTSSNGLLSGIPTLAGTYQFTIQVSNVGPPQQTATQNYSLTITNDLTVLSFNGYLPAVVTKPFQTTLQALGGQPPYTWGFVGKSQLAPGLSLDTATGIVSGSPTVVGDYPTLVQVNDSSSPQPQTTQATFTIIVNQVLHFYGTTLPDAVAGRGYFASLSILGGIGPYTTKLIAGSLPNGIELQGSRNELAGSSSAIGTSTFIFEVADSEIPVASIQQTFVLRVNPRLDFSPPPLPNALLGVPYSFTYQASGGLPPLHWILSPYIPVPSWLAMDPLTGVITGTPTQAIQNVFTIFLSDSSDPPQTDNINAFLLVLGKLQVTTSALPPVTADAPLNMQLGVTGGIGQYTWSISSGVLPPGLNLDSPTGAISGRATQTGTSTFTVQVMDAGPPAQTSTPQTLQLTVGSNLGRNDSPATATPLSNGAYQASVSPYADPPNGVGNPDSDYYKLTANPGAIVALETKALRLVPPSPLDSVMEIVDSNGIRLTTCSLVTQPAGPFDQPCMNDDIQTGVATDSMLTLQVPSNASGPQTFLVRILDFRGSARPDFLYTLTVSGAN